MCFSKCDTIIRLLKVDGYRSEDLMAVAVRLEWALHPCQVCGLYTSLPRCRSTAIHCSERKGQTTNSSRLESHEVNCFPLSERSQKDIPFDTECEFHAKDTDIDACPYDSILLAYQTGLPSSRQTGRKRVCSARHGAFRISSSAPFFCWLPARSLRFEGVLPFIRIFERVFDPFASVWEIY